MESIVCWCQRIRNSNASLSLHRDSLESESTSISSSSTSNLLTFATEKDFCTNSCSMLPFLKKNIYIYIQVQKKIRVSFFFCDDEDKRKLSLKKTEKPWLGMRTCLGQFSPVKDRTVVDKEWDFHLLIQLIKRWKTIRRQKCRFDYRAEFNLLLHRWIVIKNHTSGQEIVTDSTC